jgi:hypothetical protein
MVILTSSSTKIPSNCFSLIVVLLTITPTDRAQTLLAQRLTWKNSPRRICDRLQTSRLVRLVFSPKSFTAFNSRRWSVQGQRP